MIQGNRPLDRWDDPDEHTPGQRYSSKTKRSSKRTNLVKKRDPWGPLRTRTVTVSTSTSSTSTEASSGFHVPWTWSWRKAWRPGYSYKQVTVERRWDGAEPSIFRDYKIDDNDAHDDVWDQEVVNSIWRRGSVDRGSAFPNLLFSLVYANLTERENFENRPRPKFFSACAWCVDSYVVFPADRAFCDLSLEGKHLDPTPSQQTFCVSVPQG